jgi:intraflagellar transport protein 172
MYPPATHTFAGNERYIFDNETVCVIYHSGELTLVAYGRNEILGVCRTEHVHPTLLSVVAQQVCYGRSTSRVRERGISDVKLSCLHNIISGIMRN